jgi:hypothetical protein
MSQPPQQQPPGVTGQMEPRPIMVRRATVGRDDSLTRQRLSPGVTPASARRWLSPTPGRVRTS